MRKLGIIGVLSMLLVAFSASAALAQTSGVHFLVTDQPEFTDLGTQLQATGTIAGLGGEDVTVVLTAEGVAQVSCVSPGGNVAPGQATTITATATQTDIEVKNGRATFNLATATPTVDPAEACPNPRWTAIVTDVEFTEATITAIQDNQVVLTQTFTL